MGSLSPPVNPSLTRDALEPLVLEGYTLSEIGARLNRPRETVRRAIVRLGLPQPIDVRRRVVQEAISAGVSTLTRECRRHGVTEFAIAGSEQRLRCKKCRSEAVARRRKKVKRQLVEEAGGRCVLCGYDRCVEALEFHHRDPAKKSFGLAHRGITRSIAEVRKEAEKCVLLCSNCHSEVERGVTRLPEAIDPGRRVSDYTIA
jgi:5-methylcytosine-specific restriction endonuclease McrA